MKKKIRLGFVGAGFIGQLCHIKSFSEIKECEIVAIADKRKDIAHKVGKQYKIKNIFYSHKDLIKSNLDLDGVVIITKRTMTGPISYDFLKSNYNILTEKPMCCSLDQANKLIKIQKKKKLIFTVGYNKRFDTGVIQAKKKLLNLINNKTLGKIIFIRAHRYSGTGYLGAQEKFKSLEKSPSVNEWEKAPLWIKSDREKFAYHGYLNTFSHNINLLRYLLNLKPKVDFVDMNKDKANLVILDFKKFKCSIETKDYKDDEWDEYLKIYFENGYMQLFTPPQMKKNGCAYFSIYNRLKSEKKVYKFKSRWSFFHQSKSFIDDIKKRKNGISSSYDHYVDIKIIEEIWKKWLKK